MSGEERANTPKIDYLRPIIADGDTGHGGLTAVMKLTKMFVEKGAAGIHFEDQKAREKSHQENKEYFSVTKTPMTIKRATSVSIRD